MFHFSHTFQRQNFHVVHFYNFCLFIDILYLVKHYHQIYLYFLTHGLISFSHVYNGDFKVFSGKCKIWALSQAVLSAFIPGPGSAFLFPCMPHLFVETGYFRYHIVAILGADLPACWCWCAVRVCSLPQSSTGLPTVTPDDCF